MSQQSRRVAGFCDRTRDKEPMRTRMETDAEFLARGARGSRRRIIEGAAPVDRVAIRKRRFDKGTTTTWRELFPEGRHIFYEGDDPEGFCAEVRAEFGFDPSVPACRPDGGGFWCPPEHLDAIYGSGRWPMGS
jgi:hypothetical protein